MIAPSPHGAAADRLVPPPEGKLNGADPLRADYFTAAPS